MKIANEEIKMKILRYIIIISLLAAYTEISVCSEEIAMPTSSDAKFISRMIEKQQALVKMENDINDLLPNKAKKIDIMDTADMRYLSRMENKLGDLVRDTLNNAEIQKQSSFSPMSVHNLLPENKIKKDK
ncbi:MAG: hypothetical protein HQL29_04470 [Candidatus Omnitrophica bacterium]|nr:hypothetical protein [Candidatus Omnitrophota bacterium]